MKRLSLILLGMAILCSFQAVYAQNVEFVASYDTPGSATGVFVTGQLAYVADSDSGLLILDVSDPSDPAPFGNLPTEYPAIDVMVSGDYAYVKVGVCWWLGCVGDIEIVDVSNPAVPDSVGGTGVGFPIEFSVSGDYVYCTRTPYEESSRLYIIDVSDPDSAFVVNILWPYCESGGNSLKYLFVSDNFLYVNCNLDLQIWHVADPYNAFERGTCFVGSTRDVFAADDYAYVADYTDAGLRIVNVSNPSDPYVAGDFDTRGPARDVFVSGHYAYVAQIDSGLEIIDISDPANPVVAGSYDTPGYARRVYVQDDLIYVADSSSLMILRFNPQTGIEEFEDLPRQLVLKQNYPNPFNAATRIDFDLPASSEIDAAVYDILGRRVATLFEGQKQPGHYSLIWDAGDFPSGIYFATFRDGSQSEVIRMTLLK